MDIFKRALQLQDETIENRRYLHAHAEVGFDLPKTFAFIKEKLKEAGIETKSCGKSLVALIGNGDKDAFLLRADTDALPIEEKTGLPFACKAGNMHACGHDMHTAMLLTAGKILKEKEKSLEGKVKLLFQSAEEKLEGAKDAVKAGVLKAPKVSGAMMLHALTGLPLKSGTLIISAPGVSAPGADFFKISVTGRSCHGSSPHEGVDALAVCAQILSGLQYLSSREIPAFSKSVLTVGRLQAGKASNVIAETGIMEGTLRSFDEKLRAWTKERLTQIAKGLADVYRAEAEVVFTSGCPSLFNDETLSLLTEKNMRDLFGKDQVMNSSQLKGAVGGSEDFAYISREVPSIMVGICAGEIEKGYSYPLHHPKTLFDESALAIGSASLAYNAFRYFEK